MVINLTEAERRILANQELILAKLYPEEEWHLKHAKVYECWFSTEYEKVLNVDRDSFYAEYQETLNILNMFAGIYNIRETVEKAGQLKDIVESDLNLIKYTWFDHNRDPHYWYAQFLINENWYYKNLKSDNGVWVWALPRYRKLLIAWENLIREKKTDYWKEDLIYLINNTR